MQEHFYICFERSGGFAGISASIEVDSKCLTNEEASKLRQLIDESRFFDECSKDSISGESPDRFIYKITIRHKGRVKTAKLEEPNVPDRFRPLIRYLTLKAREKKADWD